MLTLEEVLPEETHLAESPDGDLAPLPRTHRRYRYFRLKYRVERALGVGLLVPALPVIAVCWLVVRLTSKGPGIYRQKRVGYCGKEFYVVKLRTMRHDAEADGPQWSVKGDPRITTIGRLLRALHLDELPQLFNVARGEMVLVGPRPERPEFVELLKQEIPGYERRLIVKPGITGLSQINLPPDTDLRSVERKQLLDLHHIDHANLWFDKRMVMLTALRICCIRNPALIKVLGLDRTHLVDHLPANDSEQRPVLLQELLHQAQQQEGWSAVTPDLSWQGNVHQTNGRSVVTQIDQVSRRNGKQVNGRSLPASRRVRVRDGLANDTELHAELHSELPEAPRNILTVDVEDYFQVSAFEHRISRDDWPAMECRLEGNMDRMLQLFDECGVRGTFFILGWVAHRYPGLVRRIVDGGHEVASHGYWHHLIYNQSPEEFRQDVRDSRHAISDAGDVNVTAYRAPSFSIMKNTTWALDVLVEEGFTIDSSIFPIHHDRYGMPDSQPEIHTRETESGTIVEVPPSVWQTPFTKVPIGGGYFRLFPLSVTCRAIEGVRREGRPAMLYIHPWEIDPEQPRIQGVGARSRFRHYINLSRTEPRLRRLLSGGNFAPMCEVIKMDAQQTSDQFATTAPARPR